MLETLLAILGLGFLIFIHELGHYWMAKRVGMRVEVFSIGFGSPLLSWTRQGGERWQVGWLPFGGYVKIKGTDPELGDPYAISDGFFGRGPWNRIKVAFMGPFVNILFASLIFGLLFSLGGREQFFSALTPSVGAVDSLSPLLKEGFQPGDEILAYSGQPFKGVKSHLLAPLQANGPLELKVRLHDWKRETSEERLLTLRAYKKERGDGSSIETLGVMAPASFVTFSPSWIEAQPLPKESPAVASGILPGDTIVWLDGLPIFSQLQLTSLVQEGRAFLGIQRGDEQIFRRVPRVPLASLKLDSFMREEIRDWAYEASLRGAKEPLLFIPYNLTSEGVVEERLKFIDPEEEKRLFQEGYIHEVESDLLPGDKILTIDGKPVGSAPELLKELQSRLCHLIVFREPKPLFPLPLGETQAFFEKMHSGKAISPLTLALLDPALPRERPPFVLLKGIEPLPLKAWSNIRTNDERLYLGLSGLVDRPVLFNPPPLEQFQEVLSEIGSTMRGLFFGTIDPRWISGPVGIVHLISDSWSSGFKNGLFWLAVISLNLACVNLLPLPVLDGGTILFSLFELFTGRPFSIKLIEKLIFPFALLLITLLVFFTYHDILRLFSSWIEI